MQNIISYLKQISKIFWIVFGVNVVSLTILIILSVRNHSNYDILTLAIFVFTANNALSITFYQKDKIIPYILTITSILVSIFSILIAIC